MGNCFSRQDVSDFKAIEPESELAHLEPASEYLLEYASQETKLDSANNITSPSKVFDKYCEKNIELQHGISETSKQNIAEQHELIQLKPQSENLQGLASKPINLEQTYKFSSPSQGSDRNCRKSCGLQYGVSEIFDQNLVEQQNIKASKAHTKPKTFDDTENERLYSHMLDDVMIKTFDSEEEQKILSLNLDDLQSEDR